MRYLLLCLMLPWAVHASVLIDGTFTANQRCDAYVSKNKKTNPGNLMVVDGQQYALHEMNRATNPDWFRVSVEGELRWVSKDCGEAVYAGRGDTCDKHPGKMDGYVLALSWQPGFCETYGYEVGKPECLNLNGESYSSQHFVLHGLWPNQTACGINYGFCQAKPQIHHCNYPPLELSAETEKNLKKLMPSFAFGSCLERHEWNKHGTCQSLSQDEYFAQALTLVEQFNQSKAAEYISAQRGASISLNTLKQRLDESFGQGASDKVYLGCKNGQLVDIDINLPAELDGSKSLSDLIALATKARAGRCPATINISDFTASWW